MSAFDWGALLRAGVREARLRPEEFWRLTPAELLIVLGREGGSNPAMARSRLEELSQQWPDGAREMEGSDDGCN